MKSTIVCMILVISAGAIDSQPVARGDKQAEEGTSGSVKGVVLDRETGDPLAGVNITVEDTRRGAMSDKEGKFIIQNLVPGQYTLKFTLRNRG